MFFVSVSHTSAYSSSSTVESDIYKLKKRKGKKKDQVKIYTMGYQRDLPFFLFVEGIKYSSTDRLKVVLPLLCDKNIETQLSSNCRISSKAGLSRSRVALS